jgi:hypothetical protein
MFVRGGLLLVLLTGAAGCGEKESETVAPPVRRKSAAADVAPVQPNAQPQIDSIDLDPSRPTAGTTLQAVVSASDADDDALWLSYAWTVNGEPARSEAAQLSLVHAAKGDRIELTVIASDGIDESEPGVWSATVENSAPRLVGVEILPGGALLAGMPVTVRPDARDADGDAVSFEYEWSVNQRLVRENGASLDTTKLRRGDIVAVEIVATDGEDESEPFVAPTRRIANAPPLIVSKPGAPSEDGVFVYQVAAEDPDGDRKIQFHLEQAPEGMDIDHLRGDIRWAPRPDQAGTHTVSVIADDLNGGRGRQSFEVTVGSAAPASAAE